MATNRKKKRSSSRSKRGTPLVSAQRKKEILGLILMVLALLLSLALLTYSPADAEIARDFSFGKALNPGTNRAENALGLVGATLAHLLVPSFLGYTTLLLTGLLFAWGYVTFRNRQTIYLPLLSILIVVGAFLLSILLGWFGFVLDQDLLVWSGGVGLGVASWMVRIFGAVGSVILLLLLLTVTVLLVIDHDIQRSLDRVEETFRSTRDNLRAWQQKRKERQAERRKQRMRRREERQKQREQALQERKQQQAHERAATAASPAEPPSENAQPSPPATEPSPTAPAPSASPSSERRTINDVFREQQEGAPPVEKSAASSGDASPPHDPHQEVELHVRERVEEEKADDIQRDAEAVSEDVPYEFPPIDLLDEPETGEQQIDFDELEENKNILLDKLATYNVEITDIDAIVGPTVTLYELTPAPGVKISRITSLESDLAMAMAARGIRIIAPIPGKSAVGVEIPNRHRELVRIRDVIGTAKFRDADMELPVALGKTIEGEVFLQDLTKMPHLLIAGATGSGKSVGLNALIAGLLYACHPANLKLVMIDPKKIELQQYKEIVEHYLAMPEEGNDPVITDFDEALGVLKSCEKEMEQRYDLLSKASVRSIREYNKKLRDGRLKDNEGHRPLPYIVVVVDELADLMMTSGKDVEGPIARLAQMARAVGIHLVLATQRPSVDVITGLIKANFPSRIAYQVASKVDSRTILDQNGAQGLVGNGDLLYMNGSRLLRLQGPFVSIDEIDRLMDYIVAQPRHGTYMLPPADETDDSPLADALGVEDTDELFDEAARIIVRAQQGSVSLLQRKLAVGYTRAARIVDQLEEAGVVGPFVGSKARDVLIDDEERLDQLLNAQKEN